MLEGIVTLVPSMCDTFKGRIIEAQLWQYPQLIQQI